MNKIFKENQQVKLDYVKSMIEGGTRDKIRQLISRCMSGPRPRYTEVLLNIIHGEKRFTNESQVSLARACHQIDGNVLNACDEHFKKNPRDDVFRKTILWSAAGNLEIQSDILRLMSDDETDFIQMITDCFVNMPEVIFHNNRDAERITDIAFRITEQFPIMDRIPETRHLLTTLVRLQFFLSFLEADIRRHRAAGVEINPAVLGKIFGYIRNQVAQKFYNFFNSRGIDGGGISLLLMLSSLKGQRTSEEAWWFDKVPAEFR
jgi:hypothetical protein